MINLIKSLNHGIRRTNQEIRHLKGQVQLFHGKVVLAEISLPLTLQNHSQIVAIQQENHQEVVPAHE